MWHIITIPSRFESVDAMKTVMKCVVILHNMVAEERLFAESEDDSEFSEGIIIRSNRRPMWEGMESMSGSGSIGAKPGSMAAKCALEIYKDREDEHDLTKRLVMDNLWNRFGNE